ncbi:MAG: hypothetical protein HRU09_13305 [Oligoflexales bacterium]|nr:hypothetical protein [Oligoflexales bacterium]
MLHRRLYFVPALISLVFGLGTSSSPVFARGSDCALSPEQYDSASKLSRKTRKACLEQARVFLRQPELDSDNLLKGNSDLQGTLAGGQLYCRFVFKAKANDTPKFMCYQTNNEFHYLMRFNNEVVQGALTADAQDFLLDSRGHRIYAPGDGRPLKAELLQVKYNGGKSHHREVYTELAASRLYWALGIYVDDYFPRM